MAEIRSKAIFACTRLSVHVRAPSRGGKKAELADVRTALTVLLDALDGDWPAAQSALYYLDDGEIGQMESLLKFIGDDLWMNFERQWLKIGGRQ